jgi:hypothetical protein
VRELARVLVVARHLHGRFGELALHLAGLVVHIARRLLGFGGSLRGVAVGEQFQLAAGIIHRAEARRAEEDDRVLDALATEARERLGVLGHDAQHAAVGRVEEVLVFIRQPSVIERRQLGRIVLVGGLRCRLRAGCFFGARYVRHRLFIVSLSGEKDYTLPLGQGVVITVEMHSAQRP